MKTKLFVMFFLILAFAEITTAQDKIKSHRFTLGDSTLTFNVTPNTDVYIEASDSAGSGSDTFKVYLLDTWGTETLAYLEKANVIDTGSQTYSNGLIVPGASTTVFYKLIYPYPTKLKVVRSNLLTLTDVSKIVIKAMRKPGE